MLVFRTMGYNLGLSIKKCTLPLRVQIFAKIVYTHLIYHQRKQNNSHKYQQRYVIMLSYGIFIFFKRLLKWGVIFCTSRALIIDVENQENTAIWMDMACKPYNLFWRVLPLFVCFWILAQNREESQQKKWRCTILKCFNIQPIRYI